MIRSASARTGRRISRSSNWSRCVRFPGMVVIRPADANEMTRGLSLSSCNLRHRPAALICSRQPLPIVDRTRRSRRRRPREGRLCPGRSAGRQAGRDPDRQRQRGGAVHGGARTAGAGQSISARVVSMPSWELFEEQDTTYRDSVLPPAVTARVTVEEGSPLGWQRYAGTVGVVLGHAHLRHVGADEGGRGAFRLHRRRRRRGRARQGHGDRTIA